MVNGYSQGGLNRPADAVTAAEVITQARPTSATFARLAILAWEAGQSRKGDLASQKAVSLADPTQRAPLKQQLDSAKQQSPSATSSATATPSPTATPRSSKKKSGGKK